MAFLHQAAQRLLDYRTLCVAVCAIAVMLLPQIASAAMSVTTPTPFPSTITQGQTAIMYVGSVSGGTPPYTYQWYQELPGSSSFMATTDNVTSSDKTVPFGSNLRRFNFVADTSASLGTYNFKVVVTDSASDSVNSSIVSVTVMPYNGTWPNANNTGVPVGIVLVPSKPDLYLYGSDGLGPNYVVDSLFLYGSIYMSGDNNVTFQRFYIEDPTQTGIEVQDSYDTRYIDCTMNGSSVGVSYGGTFFVNRCNMFNTETAAFMTNGSSVTNSYIHDLQYQSGFHNEDIFLAAGTGEIVRHNTLNNQLDQTASIFGQPYNGKENNVTVDDNLLNGGGYCIYGGAGGTIYNFTVTNNYFADTYWPSCGYYSYTAEFGTGAGADLVWSNDVVNKTGAPVPHP